MLSTTKHGCMLSCFTKVPEKPSNYHNASSLDALMLQFRRQSAWWNDTKISSSLCNRFNWIEKHYVAVIIAFRHQGQVSKRQFNPSNVVTTFVQGTRMQGFLKIIQTLSCWYSLDGSCWVLSYEYPYVRVSVIFQVFCIILCWLN